VTHNDLTCPKYLSNSRRRDGSVQMVTFSYQALMTRSTDVVSRAPRYEPCRAHANETARAPAAHDQGRRRQLQDNPNAKGCLPSCSSGPAHYQPSTPSSWSLRARGSDAQGRHLVSALGSTPGSPSPVSRICGSSRGDGPSPTTLVAPGFAYLLCDATY